MTRNAARRRDPALDHASGVPDEPAEVGRVSRVLRTVAALAVVVVALGALGAVGGGALLASRRAMSATEPVTQPTRSGGAAPPPKADRFLTPVANPSVRAPVNDVAAAADAVTAKAGRPLVVSSIRLYPDGRIAFGVQASDDPTRVDDWTWKRGAVSGPVRGPRGIDPSTLYPVAGPDLANLARLCDAALRATAVADGVIESPYLVRITTGLRWYLPVQSEAHTSASRTLRVAPDGSSPEIS